MLISLSKYQLIKSYLFSAKSIKQFASLWLVSSVLLSGDALSQALQPDVDFAPKQLKIGWMPGEAYNGLNGTMNHRQTDLYLPGNGKLPIEVSRYYDQTRTGYTVGKSGNFGRFTFDTPIVILYSKKNRSDRYCRSKGGFFSSAATSPLKFRYGGETKVFRASGAKLITKDGWSAECVSSRGTIGTTAAWSGTLVLRRPDGITYEMRLYYFNPNTLASYYRLYKTTDAYGNTLSYNYAATGFDTKYIGSTTPAIIRLSSIVANDGRKVTFSYISNDPYGIFRGSYSYRHVKRIESNSDVNPIVVDYQYLDDYKTIKITKNGSLTTTVETSDNRIEKITYPTGGTVTYQYGEKRKTAGTEYEVLKSRTTSDGAIYEFDYTDNGDNTFVRQIKTPSAWLNYTYGEAVKPSSYGAITGHRLNSGRIINFSRSEPGNSWSTGKKLLSVDYDYLNLDPWTNNQLHQVVVPEKVTTKMNFDSSGNAQSVFTRTSTYFDEWGYPGIVIEKNPSGSRYGNSYTYLSDGIPLSDIYSQIAIGKIKTSSGSGNSQSYLYNDQGDIKSHTVNGITTTYEWHQSGSNRGELYKEKTALDHTTTYSRYKRGQAQHIVDPSYYLKSKSINDNGTIASESRWSQYILGAKTHYKHDPLRRISEINPERSLTSSTNYTWLGNNYRSIKDDTQRHKEYEWYDKFGRIRIRGQYDSSMAQWNSVVSEYDSEGRLSFVSYPVSAYYSLNTAPSNLAGTHYTYDALDRIIQVKNDEESRNDTVISYSYGSDETGLLTVQETDGKGNSKTTTYKSYGSPNNQQPVKIKEANGQITTIFRSGVNGRIEHTVRSGRLVDYIYNAKYQLVTIDKDENGKTTFSYYADGRLKTRTNNGRKVTYQYYDNGQLHKEIYTDSDRENVTREFQYDRYQNLEYAITTSANGTQNNTLFYTYDADNNVTGLTLTVDNQSFELGFEYDELANLDRVTYPNGRVYSLSPNSLGNPTAIQELWGDEKNIYNQITYNPNQSMKAMQRNGHQIKNELNRGLRPMKFRLEEFGNGNFAALGERQYRYDKAANVKQINDTVADRYMVFSYDSRNRLINENISDANNWSYGYLANDNIDWIQQGNTRSDYEYDPSNNRLNSVMTDGVERVYEYDAQGNMTAHERLQGNGKVTQILSRNSANQLVALGDGTNYSYDARGLRVKQEKNGSIYTLYGPGERLMYRFDHQTKVSSEYFYVGGKLIARRDTDVSDQAEAETEDEPSNDDPSGITVDGLTISWPDDGWYQVQNENGSSNICEGGRSCTVPSTGTYIVINHSTGVRTNIDVT